MDGNQHKVLLFGQKVFGPHDLKLSVDYCDIEFHHFPYGYENLKNLSSYDLVILDYSAFLISPDTSYPHRTLLVDEQDIFDKLMLDALDNGTMFCFLFYDEEVPYDTGSYNDGGMEKDSKKVCISRQIGFRWLSRFYIKPYHFESLISLSDVKRNDFRNYYNKWGATKNTFKAYEEGKIDDVILESGKGYATGFSINARRGKLIFLPCQRDFKRSGSITECLTILVNSIITYLTRSAAELPDWASKPIFEKEGKIYSELVDLQEKVSNLQESLKMYEEAKKLPFLSEYQFEVAIPKFFISHLNLSIFRNEEYKEDFWITDKDSEKLIIVETKTYNRGFKKSAIYSLYNHREIHKLDEDFPALLIVNAHINANSWQEKIRPIDRQDYELAAKNNILIARIEDILYFWNAIMEGRSDCDALLLLLLKERGWLEVKKDGAFKVHK